MEKRKFFQAADGDYVRLTLSSAFQTGVQKIGDPTLEQGVVSFAAQHPERGEWIAGNTLVFSYPHAVDAMGRTVAYKVWTNHLPAKRMLVLKYIAKIV